MSNSKELHLEGLEVPSISPELKEKLEKLTSISVLNLNDATLASLDNFPNLPNLVRLELIGNSFPGNELDRISHLIELQSLSIGSNKIDSFNQIEPLKNLKQLFQLDLSDTPISQLEDYREQIFNTLPGLQILDNLSKDGLSVDYQDGGDDQVEDDDDDDDYDEDDHDMEEEDNGDDYDQNEVEIEEMGEPKKKLKV